MALLHYFTPELVTGVLLRRYKRFLVDILLDNGTEITAHCANPGSMKGLLPARAPVAVSLNTNPKAKLGWRWEMVQIEKTWVGINTGRANDLVMKALEGRFFDHKSFLFETCKREVAYNQGSRVDFLLEHSGRPPLYLEVKSVTLTEGSRALFPDSVTKRGLKHLGNLSQMVREGNRAMMLYLVQRQDVADFSIAADIDPSYAKAFKVAQKAGVEMVAYTVSLTPKSVHLLGPLPIC